jgi:hypothetical protein
MSNLLLVCAVVVIKRLSAEQCRINPCMNGGICECCIVNQNSFKHLGTPGKLACECAPGWMGRFCHRELIFQIFRRLFYSIA